MKFKYKNLVLASMIAGALTVTGCTGANTAGNTRNIASTANPNVNVKRSSMGEKSTKNRNAATTNRSTNTVKRNINYGGTAPGTGRTMGEGFGTNRINNNASVQRSSNMGTGGNYASNRLGNYGQNMRYAHNRADNYGYNHINNYTPGTGDYSVANRVNRTRNSGFDRSFDGVSGRQVAGQTAGENRVNSIAQTGNTRTALKSTRNSTATGSKQEIPLKSTANRSAVTKSTANKGTVTKSTANKGTIAKTTAAPAQSTANAAPARTTNTATTRAMGDNISAGYVTPSNTGSTVINVNVNPGTGASNYNVAQGGSYGNRQIRFNNTTSRTRGRSSASPYFTVGGRTAIANETKSPTEGLFQPLTAFQKQSVIENTNPNRGVKTQKTVSSRSSRVNNANTTRNYTGVNNANTTRNYTGVNRTGTTRNYTNVNNVNSAAAADQYQAGVTDVIDPAVIDNNAMSTERIGNTTVIQRTDTNAGNDSIVRNTTGNTGTRIVRNTTGNTGTRIVRNTTGNTGTRTVRNTTGNTVTRTSNKPVIRNTMVGNTATNDSHTQEGSNFRNSRRYNRSVSGVNNTDTVNSTNVTNTDNRSGYINSTTGGKNSLDTRYNSTNRGVGTTESNNRNTRTIGYRHNNATRSAALSR